MNTMTQTPELDDVLKSMIQSEPSEFNSLEPVDLLSDDASPTLNMWQIPPPNVVERPNC